MPSWSKDRFSGRTGEYIRHSGCPEIQDPQDTWEEEMRTTAEGIRPAMDARIDGPTSRYGAMSYV